MRRRVPLFFSCEHANEVPARKTGKGAKKAQKDAYGGRLGEEFFKEIGVPIATRTIPPPLDEEAEIAFVAKVKALARKYRTELYPLKQGTDAIRRAKLAAKLTLISLGFAGQVVLNLVVLQAKVVGPWIGIVNGPTWPRMVGVVGGVSECRRRNTHCGNRGPDTYRGNEGDRTKF